MTGDEETNLPCSEAVILEAPIDAESGDDLSCRTIWVFIHVVDDLTAKTMISGGPLGPSHGVEITLLPYKRLGGMFIVIHGRYPRHGLRGSGIDRENCFPAGLC